MQGQDAQWPTAHFVMPDCADMSRCTVLWLFFSWTSDYTYIQPTRPLIYKVTFGNMDLTELKHQVDPEYDKLICVSLAWNHVKRKNVTVLICFGVSGAKMTEPCSEICCVSCLGLMADRKSVYKRFCPVTETHSLVWPHKLSCSHAMSVGCCEKDIYLVVKQVWAIWRVGVDEEVARSHSLINSGHKVCIGHSSNSSFNGIGLELLAYMDVWDD